MFTLFNASAPSWNLFILTLLEVTATAWLYGAERYANLLPAAQRLSLIVSFVGLGGKGTFVYY